MSRRTRQTPIESVDGGIQNSITSDEENSPFTPVEQLEIPNTQTTNQQLESILTLLNTMNTRIQITENQVQDLCQNFLTNEINLTNQGENSQTTRPAESLLSPSQTADPKPKEQKHKIKEFDGDREDFDDFIQAVELYFQANPDYFQTDNSKIMKCIFLCTLKVQRWYTNKRQNGEEPRTWADFKTQFSQQYALVNASQYHLRKLKMLHQNNSCRKYVDDFRVHMYKCGYNKEALMNTFIEGLKEDIAKAVAGKEFETIEQLFSSCIKLDDTYFEISKRSKKATYKPLNSKSYDDPKPKSFIKRFQPYSKPQGSKSFPNSFVKPVNTPSGSHTTNYTSTKKPFSKKFDKKNDFKSKPKQSKLSDAEKQRRKDEGLCLYCGGEHELDDCDKRPKQMSALFHRGH